MRPSFAVPTLIGKRRLLFLMMIPRLALAGTIPIRESRSDRRNHERSLSLWGRELGDRSPFDGRDIAARREVSLGDPGSKTHETTEERTDCARTHTGGSNYVIRD